MIAELAILSLVAFCVRAVVRGLSRSRPARDLPTTRTEEGSDQRLAPPSDAAGARREESDPYRSPAPPDDPPAIEPVAETAGPPASSPTPLPGKAAGKVRLIDRSVTLKPPPSLAGRGLVVTFILAVEYDIVETHYTADRPLLGREKGPRRFLSHPRHEVSRGGCLFLLVSNEGKVLVDPRDGFTFVESCPS